MASPHRFAPVVLVAMVSVVAFAASRGFAQRAAPGFSRSQWIAEHSGFLRFSGGVRPAEGAAPPASDFAPERRRHPQLGQPLTRLSSDLLGADAGSQAETQAEPSLSLNPADERNVLAAWQESRFASGGSRALGFAVTVSGGRRWREGLLPGLTEAVGGPFERTSDPWVAHGVGGRVYMAALGFNETSPDNGVFVSASENGGQTWGAPVAVHTSGNRDFDDKEAIVVDTRADSPFAGRVYVGWDTAKADGTQPLRFAWSDDGGVTWSGTVEIERHGGNIGIVPVVGPGGIVHVFWLHLEGQNGQQTTMRTASSSDGGAHWTSSRVIANSSSPDVTGLRTGEGLPSVAIDPGSGALYLAWQDDRYTRGVDQILLAASYDGGETWSEPVQVSDGPPDAPCFTPAVAVNGRGVVGVSYYTLRNDPARSLLADEYFNASTDQARTFTPARRITGTSFNLAYAALSDGLFLGDYQGLAAGRNGFSLLFVATLERSRQLPQSFEPDVFLSGITP